MLEPKRSNSRRISIARAQSVPADPAPTTLQYRVRSYLLELIRRDGVKEGDKLPTEQELQDRFGVSRITVRNAVGQLAAMGLVLRRPGRGTFIAQPKIEQELGRLTGFVEDMHALGFTASARVILIEEIRASAYVAARLQLEPGAKIVHLQRVRVGDGEPLSLDISYLPLDIGRRVASEDLVMHPIFSLLENKYGIALGEADYVLEAVTADHDVAKHLGIKPGAPVLMIERTSHAADGRPLMHENLNYRGDRLRYRTRVKR